MKNSEMKANRFLRWSKSRALKAKCDKAIDAGHKVFFTTSFKSFSVNNKDLIIAGKDGIYIKSGKKLIYCGGCKISFN